MSSRRIWEPDGAGWRARIGVLTPHDDTVPESEFWTMAPEGVSVHTARVPFSDLRTYSDPPGPDNATEQLARLPLQGIVFAFTTSSYLLGTTGEQALTARLEKRSNGIPVLMSMIAAVSRIGSATDRVVPSSLVYRRRGPERSHVLSEPGIRGRSR